MNMGLNCRRRNVANELWFQTIWGLYEFSPGFTAEGVTNRSWAAKLLLLTLCGIIYQIFWYVWPFCSVVVLEESPCPRGSSRTNFQVLVLVLGQALILVLVLEAWLLVLSSSLSLKSLTTTLPFCIVVQQVRCLVKCTIIELAEKDVHSWRVVFLR